MSQNGAQEVRWRAAHHPELPSRPWGYGARPMHASAVHAANRGLQLLLAATAGATAYAYYHRVHGYSGEPPRPRDQQKPGKN